MTTLLAPPPLETLTPAEKLQELEQEALDLGMNPDELESLQFIGNCPAQIQTRIGELREWIRRR